MREPSVTPVSSMATHTITAATTVQQRTGLPSRRAGQGAACALIVIIALPILRQSSRMMLVANRLASFEPEPSYP